MLERIIGACACKTAVEGFVEVIHGFKAGHFALLRGTDIEGVERIRSAFFPGQDRRITIQFKVAIHKWEVVSAALCCSQAQLLLFLVKSKKALLDTE